jgi:hypothetical protein
LQRLRGQPARLVHQERRHLAGGQTTQILAVTHAALDELGDQIDITAGGGCAQTAFADQICSKLLQQNLTRCLRHLR